MRGTCRRDFDLSRCGWTRCTQSWRWHMLVRQIACIAAAGLACWLGVGGVCWRAEPRERAKLNRAVELEEKLHCVRVRNTILALATRTTLAVSCPSCHQGVAACRRRRPIAQRSPLVTTPAPRTMAYCESQTRANVEFLRSTAKGKGRVIRLNHLPNQMPVQLQGRVDPVRGMGGALGAPRRWQGGAQAPRHGRVLLLTGAACAALGFQRQHATGRRTFARGCTMHAKPCVQLP